jgi:hypothetical protein
MITRLVFLFSSILFFACADGTLSAQADAPEAVQQAFSAKYPAAKKVKWGKDRNDSFEAHFQLNGVKYRADFNPSGSWIETERSLDWGDLPDAVQDAIKEEYKKDDIVELEFTDNARKGEFYDVEIDPKGKKKFDIEYRADGSKL